MDEYEKRITELSDLAGIIPEYYDIFGSKHVISPESRAAILSAMDMQVGTTDETRHEIERRLSRKWHAVLDPVTVISVRAQPHRLAVYLPLPRGKEPAEIRVTITDEADKQEVLRFPAGSLPADQEQVIGDRRFVRFLPVLPERGIGYYTVSVVCSHPEPVFGSVSMIDRSARLIIAPDLCYMPAALRSGKTWGIGLNLYAIRSAGNWGVGDFGDLRTLVGWLSSLNAGIVGINPLHATPNTVPFGISPYSPVSRLYRNFIYIDMQAVPELSSIPNQERFAERIQSLRKSERIDYQGVAGLKRELLERAFEIFHGEHYLKRTPRGEAFREYLRAEGTPLENYALFLALAERMRNEHRAEAWPEWPEEYRSPESAAARTFRKNSEKQILFFSYVQWLIDAQLADVSRAALSADMSVGLYGDLAIGAVESGSDGWMYQNVLADAATVGAPPDDFSGVGQDWGFPPMDPDKLRESGYDLFIRTIRKNMQHLGALRIDHAMGLFRLFWIPKGMRPKDGAYVRCHAEDLLRIIALESVRNRTLVIGEDLGTITDEARQMLHRFGILSYRLFYFERKYPDPSFIPPSRYPEMALTAVTTHDLPTLSGFWRARDLEVKRQLGHCTDDAAYERQKNDRDRDRRLILQALRAQGLLPEASPADPSDMPSMTPELCRTIYRYLSLSPAKLVLVSLDDIMATIDQQNLPGTVAEYPNWMQKTPFSLKEIIADPRWQALADMFRSTRPMVHKAEKVGS